MTLLDTRQAAEVVNVIARRLKEQGGELELYQLDRFSIDELGLLVRLELEAKSLVPHRSVHSATPRSTGLSAEKSSGCASSDSQDERGRVTA